MGSAVTLVSPDANGIDQKVGTALNPLVTSASATSQALAAGTNRSGTITTGGTAQVLAAANTSRKSLTGQNISAGDLWLNEIGGTAAANTAGSYRVAPGGTFSVSTNRAISIVGATTSQAFTATEV